jgi:hypothetical protein
METVHVFDPEVCDVAVIPKLSGGGNVGAAAQHESDCATTTEVCPRVSVASRSKRSVSRLMRT